MSYHQHKNSGFTLIELMVVVAVIGMLSAIAVPQYQDYVKKAALGSALASASAYKTMAEDAIAVDGSFPAIAKSFAIGTISATSAAIASGNNTNDIVATITSGAGKGQSVTLKRNATGEWSCAVSSGVKINGCS